MSQIVASSCAKCFHSKENHYEKGVCTGDLTCTCDHYVAPFLYEFAHRIEQEKYIRKDIYSRCEYILREIPPTRNAGEKTFAKIYYEVWEGLKIRVNNPQTLDKKTWDRLSNQDTINREKRRVKANHPELATYDKKIEWHQTAIYQALLEMSVE